MQSMILSYDYRTVDMNFLPVIQVSLECKQVSLAAVSIMDNALCGRGHMDTYVLNV
jgi:hypothetical protein